LDVDEPFFISNDDMTFPDTTAFDYTSDSDDSIYTMSDSDAFDWNNDSIGQSEWWNDPAYCSFEGNIYHHDD
jgi:hypothetical protein